ncbi:hypothetical protein ACP6JA_02825 [Stutzerimonas frequens]|uniref:Uncharacterized protein n=1 Tax=Stutzerimonas frequens TaxID=2968969 RepID=A0ABX6XPJ6_9GAMM|nr:hypothetical protein [Stutzerimonas frequens]MDV3238144.1 hypothetical protein [Gammaproteobacteria bacterium]WCR44494.1 hypothetical protein OML25_00465 [Stutzerimonas stutzeri]MCQ4305169.1 hypothetical protein [Stutzerimonas frequens]PNF49325.1 hypothetical protein C1170_20290 [Stutzerimonas frequens]QPT16387.1 hypothetical protein I6G34_13120 [Stutzerimonas frequens]
MRRLIASVMGLALVSSIGAFAGAADEAQDDAQRAEVVGERQPNPSTDSNQRPTDRREDRSQEGGAALGTMGTGNSGTTGGMGATTGTDTIGGTIEE